MFNWQALYGREKRKLPNRLNHKYRALARYISAFWLAWLNALPGKRICQWRFNALPGEAGVG